VAVVLLLVLIAVIELRVAVAVAVAMVELLANCVLFVIRITGDTMRMAMTASKLINQLLELHDCVNDSSDQSNK